MGRRRKRSQTDDQYMNDATYLDYYQRMQEIALNVFEWRNLPPTVDARFMELMLYSMGYCLYFNDPIIGDLCLSCTIGGQLDVYRIPMERRAWATNGYNRMCTSSDSVLIFNNRLHTPTDLTIRLFARRLYEVQRAIDANIRQQKFPITILCDETQRLSLENYMLQFEGNHPFIYGSKDFDLECVKALETGVPYVVDKLEMQKHQIWNEFLSFVGVENSNMDKKERLVAMEAEGNFGNIEASRWAMLNERRTGAERVNQMFGTNIEVGYNSALDTLINRGTSLKVETRPENEIAVAETEGG